MASKKAYLVFGLSGPNGFEVLAIQSHAPEEMVTLKTIAMPHQAVMPIEVRATTIKKACQEWRNRRAEVQDAGKAQL